MEHLEERILAMAAVNKGFSLIIDTKEDGQVELVTVGSAGPGRGGRLYSGPDLETAIVKLEQGSLPKPEADDTPEPKPKEETHETHETKENEG